MPSVNFISYIFDSQSKYVRDFQFSGFFPKIADSNETLLYSATTAAIYEWAKCINVKTYTHCFKDIIIIIMAVSDKYFE